MTQEKQLLLLKDLCARLPYGVKILQGDVVIETLESICKIGDNDYTINPITTDMYKGFHVEQVKPYLRSMSSMTEEEESEFEETLQYTQYTLESYDWLNANHFDYRGLIPMGLALEAKEGVY